MKRMVWTPKAATRYGTPQRFAGLAIRAEFNDRSDFLSYTVDGSRYEWHRRGMPTFETRAACVAWMQEQQWLLSD